jgi:hypothetical protein
MAGVGAVEPKFVSIDTTASADIVAAVSGKRIRVYAYLLVGAATETVRFQSGGSTNLQGAMTLATGVPNTGAVPAPSWLFQTVTGEKLNLVKGGAVQVSGWLAYYLDDAE